MTISVVVPVFNDAECLARLIADLRADPSLEVIVVDGGSDDGSVDVAAVADVLVSGPRRRGVQMRLGAERANRDWLWFLHADTRVSAEVIAALRAGLDNPGWGFCRVRLDGSGWPFRMIEAGMNWRSRCSGIGTGDQGIFVHRRLLDAIGGMPSLPLMEDIECCRRLRRLARPRWIALPVETSARRWQGHGIARTLLLMWWLRLRYWFGEDPVELARQYDP